jgi:hypothetical protein
LIIAYVVASLYTKGSIDDMEIEPEDDDRAGYQQTKNYEDEITAAE